MKPTALSAALLALLTAGPAHVQVFDRAALAQQVRRELVFSWNAHKRCAWATTSSFLSAGADEADATREYLL